MFKRTPMTVVEIIGHSKELLKHFFFRKRSFRSADDVSKGNLLEKANKTTYFYQKDNKFSSLPHHPVFLHQQQCINAQES